MPVPRPLPEPIEGILDERLRLGRYSIAGAPIHYRAYEANGVRFAWVVPPVRFLLSPSFVPRSHALTLVPSERGWTIATSKAFELDEEARAWAAGLWRDAMRPIRR